MPLIGMCKLCNQVGPLQGSHIIPRAIHKQLKTPAQNVRAILPGVLKKKNQQDLMEFMLCEVCEGRFNRFETPTMAWTKRRFPAAACPVSVPTEIVPELLPFIQSIFWRASVSSSCFNYELPPKLEEALRVALVQGSHVRAPVAATYAFRFDHLDDIGSDKLIISPSFIPVIHDVEYCVTSFVAEGLIFVMECPASTLHPFTSSMVLDDANPVNLIHSAPEKIAGWSIRLLTDVKNLALTTEVKPGNP